MSRKAEHSTIEINVEPVTIPDHNNIVAWVGYNPAEIDFMFRTLYEQACTRAETFESRSILAALAKRFPDLMPAHIREWIEG